MALPTAQLGGMPTLNMPAYIPTTVVSKEPKAWEKALLAIVTQAGSQVLGQGISNSMQQDFAAQNGETPTTGVNKFFSGPKVTRGDNEARQQMLARMAGEVGMSELNSQPSARDQIMMDRQELNDIQNRTAQMQATRGQFALGREGHQNQRDIAGQEIASRKSLADAERTFNTPYRTAQIEELGAQTNRLKTDAAKEQLMMELQKRMMGGETIPDPKTGITPRQARVQAMAETKPTYDTGSTNLPAQMGNVAGSAINQVMSDDPRVQANPNDLYRQILSLRAAMPQLDEAGQAQAATQIQDLLAQLQSVSSGVPQPQSPQQAALQARLQGFVR